MQRPTLIVPCTFALITLCALAPLTPAALAQEGDKNKEKRDSAREQEQRRQRHERRIRTLQRRLGLSEAQIEQLIELYEKTRTDGQALQQVEHQKFKELLTPDQQARQAAHEKRAEESRKRRAEYRKYWMARYMGLDPAKFLRSLSLTAEQEKTLRSVIDETNTAAIEKYNKLNKDARSNGGSSGGGRRGYRNGKDYIERYRKILDSGKKTARLAISSMLNEEQRRTFEALTQQTDDYVRKSRERQDKGRERSKRRAEERQAQSPEGRLANQVATAMKSLALPAEEAAVLEPLIEKIARHQAAGQRQLARLRSQLGKLSAGSGDTDALRKTVANLRKSQTQLSDKLKSMRVGLRELLTFEQEVKLIAHGILD